MFDDLLKMKGIIIAIAAIGVGYLVYSAIIKRKKMMGGRPLSNTAYGRKIPWTVAVGDVGLFDGEDPNYCGKCKKWCDSAFSEGHSTQCDECQSTCPGVRND